MAAFQPLGLIRLLLLISIVDKGTYIQIAFCLHRVNMNCCAEYLRERSFHFKLLYEHTHNLA